jgi:hypothetical protein
VRNCVEVCGINGWQNESFLRWNQRTWSAMFSDTIVFKSYTGLLRESETFDSQNSISYRRGLRYVCVMGLLRFFKTRLSPLTDVRRLWHGLNWKCKMEWHSIESPSFLSC